MSIQSTQPELVESAYQMWAQGRTRKQMSAALGVSNGTIQNLLRAHPDYTPTEQSGSRLTSDHVRRYLAGTPAESLAQEIGVTSQTVVRWLRQEGVRTRTRKEASVLMGQAKRLDLDLDQIRSLREQGLSSREIASVLGASEEKVRQTMRDAGIPRLAARARTERNAFWNGGLVVDKSGYLLAKAPDHPNRTKAGYVRLHRLVMEHYLGRFLETEEVVDHLDGDTSDNRIQNLVLYPSNGEHLRATLTGRHKVKDRLTRPERERQRRAAVQRATARVEAIHRVRASGARLSLSELHQWIAELATGAPLP